MTLGYAHLLQLRKVKLLTQMLYGLQGLETRLIGYNIGYSEIFKRHNVRAIWVLTSLKAASFDEEVRVWFCDCRDTKQQKLLENRIEIARTLNRATIDASKRDSSTRRFGRDNIQRGKRPIQQTLEKRFAHTDFELKDVEQKFLFLQTIALFGLVNPVNIYSPFSYLTVPLSLLQGIGSIVEYKKVDIQSARRLLDLRHKLLDPEVPPGISDDPHFSVRYLEICKLVINLWDEEKVDLKLENLLPTGWRLDNQKI